MGPAVALTLALTGIAAPASADDYPSWDQVQAARGNEAATASTIATIDRLLNGLQAEAARLGDEAVARAAEAQSARTRLDLATAQATRLAARSDAAATSARRSAEQAAQIAAALYRSSGKDLNSTLLLTGDSTDLLSRLGTLGQLGGRLDEALSRAESDRNQAQALATQSEVARAELATLSAAADQAQAVAQTALEAANASVATEQANLAVLYQQLATLKNTTVQLEQQYRAGQQASNDPGTSAGGGDGAIVVPGGEVNDVAAARAYAFGRLASMGLGQEQNDCLLWLWNRESGWRTNAYNASSGAYGIPQSLPGSKMAIMGADWRTNYATQIDWGLAYISSRYGAPCGAWAHSESTGWY